MKTEIKPKIDSGFFLNAIELSRIKDSQNEQIKKISGQDAAFEYEIKYRNGTIYKASSIDEITSDENDGSRRILRVVLAAKSAASDASSIEVQFSDTSYRENSDDSPISYSVLSDDKDWTFVTSSTIEERIAKIRTSGVMNYFNSAKFRNFMLPVIMLLTMSILSYFVIPESVDKKIIELDKLRASSKDIMDFLYKIQVMNLNDPSRGRMFPFMLMLMPSALIAIIILAPAFTRWYPMYTFYWGDNIRRYDSKIATTRFLLVSVVLVVLLAMLANYFSSKLF